MRRLAVGILHSLSQLLGFHLVSIADSCFAVVMAGNCYITSVLDKDSKFSITNQM